MRPISAIGDALALPLEDGKQHDRGPDPGDRKQDLEERAQLDAGVGAGTEHVVGVVEHRVVQQQRRDGRDEGEDEEHAGDTRGPSRPRVRRSVER
jgi:hypothetical protein